MPQNHDDRYRLAFELANAGMFLVGLNGQIQEANARASEIFGLPVGALNGTSVNDLAVAEDHGVSISAISRLIEGSSERETFEKRYHHCSGRIVYGLVSVALVRDETGSPAYFISQLQDISALKQAESDLRESEERLIFALNASGLGYWDWDMATGKFYFDQRTLSMLGFDSGQLAPEIASWESLSHPKEEHDVKKTLAAHISGETASYEIERRLRHHDGHWVWILERGKIIRRTLDGTPLRMTGTLENITHRRQLEGESTKLLSQIEVLMRNALRSPTDEVSELPIQRLKKTDGLTRRQLEVLRLVATGQTSSEIATTLNIARDTVETHRRDLMRRLGLHSVAELTKLAIQEGMLPTH